MSSIETHNTFLVSEIFTVHCFSLDLFACRVYVLSQYLRKDDIFISFCTPVRQLFSLQLSYLRLCFIICLGLHVSITPWNLNLPSFELRHVKEQ